MTVGSALTHQEREDILLRALAGAEASRRAAWAMSLNQGRYGHEKNALSPRNDEGHATVWPSACAELVVRLLSEHTEEEFTSGQLAEMLRNVGIPFRKATLLLVLTGLVEQGKIVMRKGEANKTWWRLTARP